MSHRRLVRWFAGVSSATLALVTAGPALACFSPPPCSGPSISTQATSATVGQTVHDVATLSGGNWPTGTLTWNVYVANTGCVTSLDKVSVSVSGDGSYTSPNFTPKNAGTYQWVATYSGDGHNSSVSTSCNDSKEQSTVWKASPAISTTASSGIAGQSVDDVATLSGGYAPTGSITWHVYLANTGCATSLDTVSVPVDGDGTYTSPGFTPQSAGTYQWVATYSGDANNNSVASSCTDQNEQSTLSKASPAISTTAGSGMAGQSVSDAATLSGGFAPTGSITWHVYLANTGCATPLDTVSVPVTGDGTYTSPGFTPQSAGTYQWVATYSGDANNNSVASSCNDQSEQSTVQAVPVAPAPGISVTKLQRDGSTGTFTANTITAKVGDTIEYEIRATNTGNTTLALSLNDPLCNAGTILGPFAVSGTITGDVISPGAVAQYTCSHVLTAGDPSPFTNTATVTGTPPVGPAVSGTASVTANKQAVRSAKVVRCAAGKVKKHKRVHGKTVTVCVAKKVIKRVTPVFTG